ncbi:hypothetical protein O3P69_014029 [Scylla paramamosain]|uniref:Cuticle protein n=1 Tax=Scylla paramamosain TaxID=85552 RepID=A0AAW0SSN9_SCYPA
MCQAMLQGGKDKILFAVMACKRFQATPPPHSPKHHALADLGRHHCFGYIRLVKIQARRSSTPLPPRPHPLHRRIMRALVALAVLGVCSAFPVIPDDPQVAAEKERFLTTFKIIEEVSQPKGGSLASRPADVYVIPPPQPKWMGPLASKVPASLPGSTPFVADTPEVINAKTHFYNTYNSQVIATRPRPGSPSYYYSEPSPAPKAAAPSRVSVPIAAVPIYVPETPQKKWYGPLASEVPASLPGSSPVVFDTPEVNNAKAHFFNTYRRQVKAVTPRRMPF